VKLLPAWGVVLMLGTLTSPLAGQDVCTGRGTILLVLTTSHELCQCESGRKVHFLRVSLGSGGTGKTRSGDRKTPLGIYPLGTPRTSKDFGLFIPFGYPTPEQRKLGYTGSDLGLHGPRRGTKDSGAVNVENDWTWGCIAVASDSIIFDIAKWLREKHVEKIELL